MIFSAAFTHPNQQSAVKPENNIIWKFDWIKDRKMVEDWRNCDVYDGGTFKNSAFTKNNLKVGDYFDTRRSCQITTAEKPHPQIIQFNSDSHVFTFLTLYKDSKYCKTALRSVIASILTSI